MRAAVSTSLMR